MHLYRNSIIFHCKYSSVFTITFLDVVGFVLHKFLFIGQECLLYRLFELIDDLLRLQLLAFGRFWPFAICSPLSVNIIGYGLQQIWMVPQSCDQDVIHKDLHLLIFVLDESIEENDLFFLLDARLLG